MTELDSLYQKNILLLAKIGQSSARLENPEFSAVVKNPVCGDQVTIDVSFLSGQTIIGADVRGCALCEAATGLIVARAHDINRDQAKTLKDHVRAWLIGQSDHVHLDRLENFAPVKVFDSRIDCVLLPFQALAKCVEQDD